jgi:intracellular sulfur oxidation DsrE/DsrF family protein
MKMKRKSKTIMMSALLSVCLLLFAVTHAFGEGYEALKGLTSLKAVFEVRAAEPRSAALQLNLVRSMYKDNSIREITKKPAFVVVFIGPAVKLVSTERKGFPAEQHKILDEIASTISEMSKDGIELEICLFAAHLLGVNAASILPEIKQVDNGWISLIGYQAKGYSLVPVY